MDTLEQRAPDLIQNRRTVLIVDDDLPTQQLMSALMRRNGFTCVIASNGGEAIDLLTHPEEDFAVIILDLMMPAVSGQAVIDFVSRERKQIPIIVCTAAGPRMTETIKSSVVRAIVRKPFDIDELSALVASLTSA